MLAAPSARGCQQAAPTPQERLNTHFRAAVSRRPGGGGMPRGGGRGRFTAFGNCALNRFGGVRFISEVEREARSGCALLLIFVIWRERLSAAAASAGLLALLPFRVWG